MVHAIPKDINRGYIQSRNFTLQKQFGKEWIVQVSYVGTLVVHQFTEIDLNAGQVIGAGVSGQALTRAFGRTATTPGYAPIGTTNHNALQATASRRFAAGFQAGASYTWSKAIGNRNTGIESFPTVQDLAYFNLNRAVLPYDRTQVLNATGIWELPFGKAKRFANTGLAARLFGGWQLNGILTGMTGLPFSVTASGTSLNLPGSTQLADQINAQVIRGGGTGPNAVWFDKSAFAPVTQARFDNSGKNTLRGPKLGNLDRTLSRIPCHRADPDADPGRGLQRDKHRSVGLAGCEHLGSDIQLGRLGQQFGRLRLDDSNRWELSWPGRNGRADVPLWRSLSRSKLSEAQPERISVNPSQFIEYAYIIPSSSSCRIRGSHASRVRHFPRSSDRWGFLDHRRRPGSGQIHDPKTAARRFRNLASGGRNLAAVVLHAWNCGSG